MFIDPKTYVLIHVLLSLAGIFGPLQVRAYRRLEGDLPLEQVALAGHRHVLAHRDIWHVLQADPPGDPPERDPPHQDVVLAVSLHNFAGYGEAHH